MNEANGLISSSELTRPGTLFRLTAVTRGDFFAALFLIACVNGLVPRVISSVSEKGFTEALLSTFDTSVVVLLACCVGITLVSQDRFDHIRNRDLSVGIPFIAIVALPVAGSSWLGVTGLALYIITCTERLSKRLRGTIILLATSFSMFWSPLLFNFLCKPILDIDAALAAWLSGTLHIGNMVRFADDLGYLVVFPACSSFANVSLALLTWVVISQSVGHRSSMRDIFWCFLACAAVVAVNVSRLSMMTTDMHHFEMVHNQWGSAIANVVILILVTCYQCLKRSP